MKASYPHDVGKPMLRFVSFGVISWLLLLEGAARADNISGEEQQLAAARQLIQQSAYGEAISVASAALVELPRNPELYNLLGFAHQMAGDVDEAGLAYDCALEIDPTNLATLELQGRLYVQLKQWKLASRNLKKLEAACGKQCDAYENLRTAITAAPGF